MALDLNSFGHVRARVLALRRLWLQWRYGAIVHPSSQVSFSARLVASGKGSIEIGADTLLAFKSLVLTRSADGVRGPVRIGNRCFIGGGAIVMPGVTLGDCVVVGAGAVVTQDVPSRCAVAGNPAVIVRRNILVGRFGRQAQATLVQRRHYAD